MSEARIFWNYTCPICDETFPYGAIAGKAIKICDKCQTKEMIRSTGGGYY